jgi:uracil-DNA glycosylase
MEKRKTIDDFFKPKTESAKKSKGSNDSKDSKNTKQSPKVDKVISSGKRKASSDDLPESKKRGKKLELESSPKQDSKISSSSKTRRKSIDGEINNVIDSSEKISTNSNINLKNFQATPENIKSQSNFNPAHSLTSLETFEDFINGLCTWKEYLNPYINSDKMKNTYNFVKKEYAANLVHPSKELIFNAFNKTSWDNLKVVIIGQDPYPNVGQAMGLSFSVNRGVAVPMSLKNIYKCLEKDNKLTFKAPKHGDLSRWAEQGVFLLNATLTVIDKKPNSHQKNSGWSEFTDNVIKVISQKKEGIVFLLWGNFAIQKKKLIDVKKHHVIENIHPSPLAATKGDFTKSDQFSKANEYLEKEGKGAVDWNLPA